MKAALYDHPVFWPSVTGFGLGAGSGSTYLLCGGSYFLNVPDWATIMFFPGFVAGYQVYGWGIPEEAAKLIGVVVVGLAYAALAWIYGFAWLALSSLKSVDRAARTTWSSR